MKKMGIFSLIFIVLDQIIKYIVVSSIEVNNHIRIIKKFFYIAHVENDGAAWSILAGNRWLLVIIGIVAIGTIYIAFIKDKILSNYDKICYSLLIGGIGGNLIDRVIHGYVIDYLEFIFGRYHYPIFNLADICIVVSILLIIVKSIREDVCKKK